MFERELVRESVGRAAENRGVAERVQRGEATQFAGISNAGGICAATCSFIRLRASRYAGRRKPLTDCECRMIEPAEMGGRSRESWVLSRIDDGRYLVEAELHFEKAGANPGIIDQ